MKWPFLITPLCVAPLLLTACAEGTSGRQLDELSEAAQLGKLIFHDASLSASGALACVTCHDPGIGHASPFDQAVPFGGEKLDQPGMRLSPGIRYIKFNGPFRMDASGAASGGFFWDGRADSLQAQAKGPLLAANEMGNASPADVVDKVQKTPYAKRFAQLFGENIFRDPASALDRVAYTLARYQIEDKDFAPFNSKFDAVNAGKVKFTEQELRGLTWFNRRDKGNCASCHPSAKPENAPGALFTDFTYDSLGVPRNGDIAANRDAQNYDKGLCGPVRTDSAQRDDLCGKFKVPSLRNVAVRKRFFHNGKFSSLEEVLSFYVTRDTAPVNTWYASEKFDDLPMPLKGNVNVSEAPYDRKPGQQPALTTEEMADVIAFLKTLTDGYVP